MAVHFRYTMKNSRCEVIAIDYGRYVLIGIVVY